MAISPDPTFDEAAYLDLYGDVRDAVHKGIYASGWEHFLRFGKAEGRSQGHNVVPEPLPANDGDDEDFDEGTYLWLHADVRHAVEQKVWASGWAHYQHTGKAEGRAIAAQTRESSHAVRDYTQLVKDLIAAYPDDLALAMAKAIGTHSHHEYAESGDRQYAMLQRAGLKDGFSIYDLACGSGRTAAALARNGWQGRYRGADLIRPLIDYATATKPGFEFFVHRDYSVRADSASLDMVYAWSLFTHLQLEEILLYATDIHRALKPGGLFAFSILTLDCPGHVDILKSRAATIRQGNSLPHLDTFLARSTVTTIFEHLLGFQLVDWVDADDASATRLGAFGQAVAVYRK